MKKTILPALFLLFAGLLAAQSDADTLTNEKIIQLTKIGLDPSIIISKIETSINIFDVSTDALIDLNSKGVSPDVINAMIKADAKQKAERANQKDIRDPKTMRQSGIYYYNSNDTANLFQRLEPSVISGTRSGKISYGVINRKVKANVAGANSNLQIGDSSPVFYFYFENKSNQNSDNWFFATATSPNEFVLVAMNEKKNNRELVIGTENSYVAKDGVPEKDKIPFDFEEVANGVYKVSFKEPLKKGEYCFIYASSRPTHYNNDKVFDFGINIEK